MNINEQPQARLDLDIREDRETAMKGRVGDQSLSTRDLAGGAAPKPERIKDVPERDHELPNGRDM